MIEKVDLVVSNLIRYFYADKKVDEINARILALEQTLGARSPNLTDLHGYSGTRDQKLNEYSIKKAKLDDELKGWKSERKTYYNVLHLDVLNEEDIKLLEYLYKHKKRYEDVAILCHYTNKSYVSRKKDSLLEKMAKLLD